jgi:hypothetical protein
MVSSSRGEYYSACLRRDFTRAGRPARGIDAVICSLPMGGTVKDGGFSLETRVGRLIEARIFDLRTSDDAEVYSAAMRAHILRLPTAKQPILLADHRPIVIYPQAAADRLVELFTQMNAQLERVAIIAAPSNATLVLQLNRIVREAAYARRRVVFTPDDVVSHLAAALDSGELARARAFLDEYPPRMRAPGTSSPARR